MSGEATAARIPAWKRLGLKLKNAQADEPASAIHHSGTNGTSTVNDSTTTSTKHDQRPLTEPNTPSNHENVSKKRKRGAKATDSIQKPLREAHSPASHSGLRLEIPEHDAGDESHPSLDPVNAPSQQEAKTNPLAKRKKSVTFTSDTKPSEADNAQVIPPTPHPVKSTSIIAADTVTSADASGNSDVKVTKASKKLRRRQNAETRPSAPTPQYLTYLDTYHKSRDTWKFSKAHQTSLLKNMWNLYRISSSYDPALEAYLAGLLGAGARSRLATQANDVLAQDESRMKQWSASNGGNDDIDAMYAKDRRVAREEQLARHMEIMRRTSTDDDARAVRDEMRQAIDKAQRAETVLRALGTEMGLPGFAAPNSAAVQGATDGGVLASKRQQESTSKPTKRKRKSRTAQSDDSDSSDSDSSSSSDSAAPNTTSAGSKRKTGSGIQSKHSAVGSANGTVQQRADSDSSSNTDSSSSSESDESDDTSTDDSSDADEASSSASTADSSSDAEEDSDSVSSADQARRDHKRARISARAEDKPRLKKANGEKATFDKAFLDRTFPKQDYSDIKARVAEQRRARKAKVG